MTKKMKKERKKNKERKDIGKNEREMKERNGSGEKAVVKNKIKKKGRILKKKKQKKKTRKENEK